MELFNTKKIFDFMKIRYLFLFFSSFLVIASIILLLTKGLNFGIDFVGGTIVQVKYEQNAPIEQIKQVLKPTKYGNSVVTKFGSDKEVVIRITGSSSDLTNDISDEMSKLFKSTGNFEIRKIDMVGAKVGSELREKGLMALGLSVIAMLVYLSFRFEWKFAVASIIGLVHDIIVTMGAISLFQVEVNLDILAAILTLLGYSINDTIIVFDRIREGVLGSKITNISRIINESVSKTLSRTTLTSLTTLFVVATLLFFGGEIIYGFSFTLFVGIIMGTYSSIYIASTFLIQLKFSVENFRTKESEKIKRQKEKKELRSMYEQGTI